MVTLYCAVVGVAGSAFPVDIDVNKSVGHLKKAIKEENLDDPTLKNVAAKDLQLFLAKKGDAWLPDDDPAALELEEGKTHQDLQKVIGGEKMKATWTIEDVLIANKMTKRRQRAPKSKQIHVLVVVPPEEKTSSPYAVIATTLFQHTFLNVPSTTASRTQKLKKQLVKEYECDCGRNQIGDSMLLCMVMNIGLPSSVVIASHIFRREHDRLKDYFVQIADIDDVRNGLLLFKPIESAFDDLDIAFLVDKEDQFTLKLFNPDFKSKLLVDSLTQKQWDALGGESIPTDWETSTSPVYAPYAPEFNVLTTFGELDGKPLRFPSGSTLRPFRRCLYHQAQLARTKALVQGWVSEDYNFDDFSSEGFTLEEKMKLLFSSSLSIPESPS
ncbi:hypothetical protein Pcac1_g22129 [Phytophthora cactorum]|nr:hypothetical protein Pcac1_g22129 [Phytophthora cactorum]KAG2797901.1 hypothetical protein PC112_g21576 [Phytophthora cactorum]KAG3191619.1 hypothetical protein PC128_g10866 [Phytophthora cactorum]